MVITLVVSVVAVLAAYPLAFFLAFVAHRARLAAAAS
jgi:ABC-type spermidine/putrescine transport system permease subunit I